MDKRGKVIKGLQEAVDWLSTETSMTVVDQWVVRDALALLKAQEPVEPIHLHDQSKLPIKCGNCGAFIIIINNPFGIEDYKANYCCECGRAVKWE